MSIICLLSKTDVCFVNSKMCGGKMFILVNIYKTTGSSNVCLPDDLERNNCATLCLENCYHPSKREALQQ